MGNAHALCEDSIREVVRVAQKLACLAEQSYLAGKEHLDHLARICHLSGDNVLVKPRGGLPVSSRRSIEYTTLHVCPPSRRRGYG